MFVYRQGRTGNPFKKDRCCASVQDRTFMGGHWHQCPNSIRVRRVFDGEERGFCRIHDPVRSSSSGQRGSEPAGTNSTPWPSGSSRTSPTGRRTPGSWREIPWTVGPDGRDELVQLHFYGGISFSPSRYVPVGHQILWSGGYPRIMVPIGAPIEDADHIQMNPADYDEFVRRTSGI